LHPPPNPTVFVGKKENAIIITRIFKGWCDFFYINGSKTARVVSEFTNHLTLTLESTASCMYDTTTLPGNIDSVMKR
jgi:hypothetical protein